MPKIASGSGQGSLFGGGTPFQPYEGTFLGAEGASSSGNMCCEYCAQAAYPHCGDGVYGDSDTDDDDGYSDAATGITALSAHTNGDSTGINQLG